MLKKYLPSVVSNTQDAEIIIADNCSTDKSVEWIKEKYPELRIIQLTQNWGFAEGYNKALKEVQADGTYNKLIIKWFGNVPGFNYKEVLRK